MQNAGIDEVTARATDNAENMDIPDQLPKTRRKRASRQQMKEWILRLTSQQKLSNECLEVYDVIFGLIQWRFEKTERSL